MSSEIIGSFEEFVRCLPVKRLADHTDREDAMRHYLLSGGIARLGPLSESGCPVLLYPTPARIQELTKENDERLRLVEKRIKALEDEGKELTGEGGIKEFLLRATDPLYIEHRTKLMTDGEYRKTYERVAPPMRLHAHRRKKLVREFVKNEDYRRKLLEARSSEIGKNRPSISEELSNNTKFKQSLLEKSTSSLLREREILLLRQRTLMVLLKWSSETA